MVDPSARIAPGAKLADGVRVGPFSVIGDGVEIGAGTTIQSHVVITGPTIIGEENRIFSGAVIGGDPQDKKYAGEDTGLTIGHRNTLREYCTINRGTAQGGGRTLLGNDNWIMAYVHIAHDCMVGNNTIFANSASLAGHVLVEDFAILGGFTLVHQFCKLGAHCFTGMNTVLSKDLPTYMMASGNPAKARAFNVEGLRRRGFQAHELAAVRRAHRILYRSGLSLGEAISRLEQEANDCERLLPLVEFLQHSSRGIVR